MIPSDQSICKSLIHYQLQGTLSKSTREKYVKIVMQKGYYLSKIFSLGPHSSGYTFKFQDGNAIVCANDAIKFWNLETGECRWTFDIPNESGTKLKIITNNVVCLTRFVAPKKHLSQRLRILNFENGHLLKQIENPETYISYKITEDLPSIPREKIIKSIKNASNSFQKIYQDKLEIKHGKDNLKLSYGLLEKISLCQGILISISSPLANGSKTRSIQLWDSDNLTLLTEIKGIPYFVENCFMAQETLFAVATVFNQIGYIDSGEDFYCLKWKINLNPKPSTSLQLS